MNKAEVIGKFDKSIEQYTQNSTYCSIGPNWQMMRWIMSINVDRKYRFVEIIEIITQVFFVNYYELNLHTGLKILVKVEKDDKIKAKTMKQL